MILGPGISRTYLPKKFLASGINSGLRRYRPDLGIIISEIPSIAVGVFTRSTLKAAPITYCEQLLPADNIKAVITNSGQANAATGEAGIIDNQQMVSAVAQYLACDSKQVLSASTGVIGERLQVDKITAAIPQLIDCSTNIAEKFATAILTTDLVPKTVYKQVALSQGEAHITGICKGSGMIHPNMGTMLAYILTDLELKAPKAQDTLKVIVDGSFNMISIDGETSPNDCVFLLANGASGVKLVSEADKEKFHQALQEIAMALAMAIVRDGEGATKLIEVKVSGSSDLQLAKRTARALTVSPLIKTAIHGGQPNWGRILQRLGAEQVPKNCLARCSVYFQGHKVYNKGKPGLVDTTQLIADMKKDTINIEVNFSSGNTQAIAWGADLSERYIKINAEYLT